MYLDGKYCEAEMNYVFDFLKYRPDQFIYNEAAISKEDLFSDIVWKFGDVDSSDYTLFEKISADENFISLLHLELPVKTSSITVKCNRRFPRVIDVMMLATKIYEAYSVNLSGYAYSYMEFENNTREWAFRIGIIKYK
jgi:hypothetical protein